jgi:hypothetical protein
MPSLQATDSTLAMAVTNVAMTGARKPDRSRYSIIPIGSLATSWGLKVDGIIRRSGPSLLPLAAYVDAVMAGADEADADLIAKAIEARPWPDS